jgi:hypothetical protein
MDFDNKLADALAALEATGMKRRKYAPPLARLLWRLGLRIPPPHYASFAQNALSNGVYFAVAWGAGMWVAVWSRQGMPLWLVLGAAVLAGILFGLSLAVVYQRDAKRYLIPRWKDFRSDDAERGV